MRALRRFFWTTYVGGFAAASCLYSFAIDAAWWTMFLGYVPRWPLLTPALLVLVAGLLFVSVRLVSMGALGSLVWLIFIARFNLALPAEPVAGPVLTFMTYNLGNGTNTTALRRLAEGQGADVLAMQECRPTALKHFGEGWYTHARGGLCLASRYPFSHVEKRDPRDFWKRAGSGAMVRYHLDTGGSGFTVLNVHLETPRGGIEGFVKYGYSSEAVADARRVLELRDDETSAASDLADDPLGNVVVLGDFNQVAESVLMRRHFGDLANGFSKAGIGFGATKRTHWHGVRIDHVLLSDHWRTLQAYVADSLGGDHSPVLVRAELREEGVGR